MSNKVGFIGCGKMASAIISGICSCELKNELSLMGSEFNEEIAKSASKRLEIEVVCNNVELVKNCDVIFIATKPNCVEAILNEIKSELTDEKLLVSIAAGVKISKIENIIDKKNSVIRVMPNTPALVKEGMSVVCRGTYANDDEVKFVLNMLSKVGVSIELEESKIDIVTAISGSGPAFFYKIMHEMALAGEKLGLEYDKSLTLAVQTAIGSAKMILNSEKMPVELVESVATKGGCTEVGVNYMNEVNSENIFYNLIQKTTQKASELG